MRGPHRGPEIGIDVARIDRVLQQAAGDNGIFAPDGVKIVILEAVIDEPSHIDQLGQFGSEDLEFIAPIGESNGPHLGGTARDPESSDEQKCAGKKRYGEDPYVRMHASIPPPVSLCHP
ncbi:hypothetical protein [Methylobacterium terricola]|uniref:hypothetical protein n=1 Tax=Methylobacterium terricola TaxID=2583531 RepID=UPI001112A59B|nr:hypothetical protein [Methylobacterium terricola]